MPDRAALFEAIRQSWTESTSAVPDEWSPANPARGQCDASSFVVFEHLGGDLVLGEVIVDGERTEHHYWNRIDGTDVDLTAAQFCGGEVVHELSVLDSATIRARQGGMRAELARRIDVLGASVAERLVGATGQ